MKIKYVRVYAIVYFHNHNRTAMAVFSCRRILVSSVLGLLVHAHLSSCTEIQVKVNKWKCCPKRLVSLDVDRRHRWYWKRFRFRPLWPCRCWWTVKPQRIYGEWNFLIRNFLSISPAFFRTWSWSKCAALCRTMACPFAILTAKYTCSISPSQHIRYVIQLVYESKCFEFYNVRRLSIGFQYLGTWCIEHERTIFIINHKSRRCTSYLAFPSSTCIVIISLGTTGVRIQP